MPAVMESYIDNGCGCCGGVESLEVIARSEEHNAEQWAKMTRPNGWTQEQFDAHAARIRADAAATRAKREGTYYRFEDVQALARRVLPYLEEHSHDLELLADLEEITR